MPADVLHILGSAGIENTGIARIVGALARNLDPGRYRIHACFLGADGPLVSELQAAGAVVQRLEWEATAKDPLGACRFWRALHERSFAIVHQHYGNRAVRWLVRRGTRARCVVHLHTRVFEPRGNEPVVSEVSGVDAIIAVSEAVARNVRGVSPVVIYPGVAAPGIVPAGHGPPHVIGTASRLAPIKGLTYLLRALAVLLKRIPDVRLEIAGAGPQQQALADEARALGLRESVTFLGWQPDLSSVLRKWDIFVQPSLDEGFAITTLEAMASGLPVVASAVGGLQELVVDGATGYLVPPRDPDVLAQRLATLLLAPGLRRTMGAAGHARAGQNFSVDRMVSAVSDIYDRLVGLG